MVFCINQLELFPGSILQRDIIPKSAWSEMPNNVCLLNRKSLKSFYDKFGSEIINNSLT